MDSVPKSASVQEQNEYYQFIVYELRDPDFPREGMTQFRTFKKMKKSGEYEVLVERRKQQAK